MEDLMHVYDRLYDIVQGNMKKTGSELRIRKETFLFDVGKAPGCFDVMEAVPMENDLFFLTAYREMLLRMPDPGTCDKWSDMMNKPAETFQQSLVKSLCNSKEIRIKRVRLRNNPYSELYYNEGTASGFGRLEKLHKLYMRLPELIRRLIKKIFC